MVIGRTPIVRFAIKVIRALALLQRQERKSAWSFVQLANLGSPPTRNQIPHLIRNQLIPLTRNQPLHPTKQLTLKASLQISQLIQLLRARTVSLRHHQFRFLVVPSVRGNGSPMQEMIVEDNGNLITIQRPQEVFRTQAGTPDHVAAQVIGTLTMEKDKKKDIIQTEGKCQWMLRILPDGNQSIRRSQRLLLQWGRDT